MLKRTSWLYTLVLPIVAGQLGSSELPGNTETTFGSIKDKLTGFTKILLTDYEEAGDPFILPHLNKAPSIGVGYAYGTAATHGRVDIDPDVHTQYKILPMSKRHHQSLLELHNTRRRDHARSAIDALLLDIIPHVKLGDRKIGLDDLYYFSLVLDRGAYFPFIHWDTDWMQYPSSAGFQVWFMLDAPKADLGHEGSMFMVHTDALGPGELATTFRPGPRGQVVKMLHDNARRLPREPFPIRHRPHIAV